MDKILEEYDRELEALFKKFQKADTILASVLAGINLILFIVVFFCNICNNII